MDLSVSTTERAILGRNGSRKYLLFVNQHTDTVRISFGNVAASGGVPIAANGGSWELNAELFLSIQPDSYLFMNVNAVAASGSGTLTVVEG